MVDIEERLAQLISALDEVGLETLVMGGHAVRYYGVGRNTVDFDFVVSAATTQDVREKLARSPLLKNSPEGLSWRREDFIRFEIGKLPNGREELLEFWLHNPLLPDFSVLRPRAERGVYGGREMNFIGLSDLLRSKETEREEDWRDIELLEEIRDARNLSHGNDDTAAVKCLALLRSRRGFDRAMEKGLFSNAAVAQTAVAQCEHPISFAYLQPVMVDPAPPWRWPEVLDGNIAKNIFHAELGSRKHLGYVEVVRLSYRRWAQRVDREDKQNRLHQK